MRRRCLGLIRPYLDETAHLSLETWSILLHHLQYVQMGSKTVGTYAFLQAPGSEDHCTSERC
jgi:hypothetical protein